MFFSSTRLSKKFLQNDCQDYRSWTHGSKSNFDQSIPVIMMSNDRKNTEYYLHYKQKCRQRVDSKLANFDQMGTMYTNPIQMPVKCTIHKVI